MKARPVRRHDKPAYPDRRRVLEDPLLLQKNVPPAWRSIPGMAGAVAVFLVANASLNGADISGGTNKSVAVVAPIFVHGEGRGVFGGFGPLPDFLSEQEAMRIIGEELVKQGVTLTHKLQPLLVSANIENPQLIIKTPLEADAWDTKKNLAVEYVSGHDHFWLDQDRRKEDPSSVKPLSTVMEYDFPKAAKYYSNKFADKAKKKIYLGTFYEPIGKVLPNLIESDPDLEKHLKDNPEEREKLLRDRGRCDKTESQRLLRLQVQDFVKWLQGQGVI